MVISSLVCRLAIAVSFLASKPLGTSTVGQLGPSIAPASPPGSAAPSHGRAPVPVGTGAAAKNARLQTPARSTALPPDPRAGTQARVAPPQAQAPRTLDTIEKIFRILAYICGGLWVYFNYLRGRVHRPRLELTLSGEFKQVGAVPLIRVKLQVKNVGLTKVDIQQEGTGLRFLSYDPASGEWRHLRTVPVLEHHSWIEPGEPVVEDFMESVDVLAGIFQLEVYLTSGKAFVTHYAPYRREKVTWYSRSFVT